MPPPRKRAKAESKEVAMPPPRKRARTFVDGKSTFSTGGPLAKGTVWPHHHDSDDSDAYEDEEDGPPEGFVRLYRALSEAEQPLENGISPFKPRSKRTVAEHVQGGGKSSYVSFTSSKRKAVKWALKTNSKNKARVATVDVPLETEVVDLSFSDTSERAGLGSTGKNFARSSSEVLFKGKVPQEFVRTVETVTPFSGTGTKTLVVKTRVLTGLKKNNMKPEMFSLNPEI